MQIAHYTITIILSIVIVPINSYTNSKVGLRNNYSSPVEGASFLSADDFYRAQNLSFSETQQQPVMIHPLNDPEMHYTYYEGDMMIQESDEKKIAMYTAKRWPEGRIPYMMENKFSDLERAAIARGMMILQERTCIRFLPKEENDYDYVLIKRGPGCAAHVGRLGGQQWVILGEGCYGIETITHELMHSVGFIHEQSRPDRDEHVEIVWKNIKPNAVRNFRKHESDYLADHGFPYDLMSVMHYRQYAFSKNRKPTILPKRPVPYLRCRGMDCPSELDIEKINFLYKCHKKDPYGDNYIESNSLDNEIEMEDMLSAKANNINHNINYNRYEFLPYRDETNLMRPFPGLGHQTSSRFFQRNGFPPLFFHEDHRSINSNHHHHHLPGQISKPYPMVHSLVIKPTINIM